MLLLCIIGIIAGLILLEEGTYYLFICIFIPLDKEEVDLEEYEPVSNLSESQFLSRPISKIRK
jgi:hypothetical protein